MNLVFMDIETYNDVPIRCGSHKYAETAEILLFGYATGEGRGKVWDATASSMPEDLKALLEDKSAKFVFHNGMNFDAVVLQKALPQYDWSPSRIVDTMVIAYQHGLPGSLADLCTVLGLSEEESKDKRGERLITLFCQPRPTNCKNRRATRETNPEEWTLFKEYCRKDVESMREIYTRLPKFNLTKREREIQLVDAEINRRGVLIDTELAKAAVELDAKHHANMDTKMQDLTGGMVGSGTQRQNLIDFLEREYGLKLDKLTKPEVERRIASDEVPEPIKDLLRLRLSSAATSSAKYSRVLEAVNSDNRLRGTLQFRGAIRTGRYAGRIFQPQNMSRPAFNEKGFFEAIELIKSGYASLFYEDLRPVLSTCLRGLLIAPEGKTFLCADYSNVEGRVLAWLAGEDWKLKAFVNYDKGTGHDLYKMTYGTTFNVDPGKVSKPQRQMGKVLELAMGYAGGAGAFVTFANGYGMDLDKVAMDIYSALDPTIVEESKASLEFFKTQKNGTHGLSDRTFVAVDAVKRAWRLANPHIAKFWSDTEQAVLNAINDPGKTYPFGKNLAADVYKNFLRIKLPSGRFLAYALPRVSLEKKGIVTFVGLEQSTRKWGRLETFGGRLVENITQATACDLLCASLVQLEKEGFNPVMHVHDEILCEVDEEKAEEFYKRMCEIMTHPGDIYKGLPLSVDGFIGNRYKKKD